MNMRLHNLPRDAHLDPRYDLRHVPESDFIAITGFATAVLTACACIAILLACLVVLWLCWRV